MKKVSKTGSLLKEVIAVVLTYLASPSPLLQHRVCFIVLVSLKSCSPLAEGTLEGTIQSILEKLLKNSAKNISVTGCVLDLGDRLWYR